MDVPTAARAVGRAGGPAGTARRGEARGRPSGRTSATPWGPAVVVEQVSVSQRAGDRRFAVVVQLLHTADGEPLVRLAYTTDGAVRRGPVTMRARDLERLRAALGRAPVLEEALGL